MRYQIRCVCGHLSAFEIIPMPVVPSHGDMKISDEPTRLHNANARLLAVARAADAYLLAHEGWMSRGKWDRAMLLGEDLQTALAAVEDLL